MSAAEENKAIVRRFQEELFNHQGMLDAADEFIAADFVDHSAPPGLAPGLKGLKQQAVIFRTAFPDIYSRIEGLIAEGDKVVDRWTGGGTHKGDLFGIPPTGKHVTASGIHIFRIADGKIVEHWGNSDDLGMLQQLGVIPSAG